MGPLVTCLPAKLKSASNSRRAATIFVALDGVATLPLVGVLRCEEAPVSGLYSVRTLLCNIDNSRTFSTEGYHDILGSDSGNNILWGFEPCTNA